MKRLLLILAVLALVAGAIVPAMAQRGRDRAGGTELAYGSDELQRLDYWAGKDRNAPLVVFVHGGGWKRGA